jgi:hypothetical protein
MEKTPSSTSRIVFGVFTDLLLGNRHLIVARVGSRGNVFAKSLLGKGCLF